MPIPASPDYDRVKRLFGLDPTAPLPYPAPRTPQEAATGLRDYALILSQWVRTMQRADKTIAPIPVNDLRVLVVLLTASANLLDA